MNAVIAIENCSGGPGLAPGAASCAACALPIANLHSHPTRQKGPFQGAFCILCVLCKLYSILTERVIGQRGREGSGLADGDRGASLGSNLHGTHPVRKPLRHAALSRVGWGFIWPNTGPTRRTVRKAAANAPVEPVRLPPALAYMSVHANGQSGAPVRSRGLPATSATLPRQNAPAGFAR